MFLKHFIKPPWWNRRTKLERALLFVTVTCLLMVSVMAVALAVFGYIHQKNANNRHVTYFSANPSELKSENATLRKLCLTPGCVKAAAAILNNIDEKVNPCENFFQFACGGWLDKHTISEDRASSSVFTDTQDDLNQKLKVLMDKPLSGDQPEFIKMIKTMYDSCMDLPKIEKLGSKPLEALMAEFGGWPVVLGAKWNESGFDWIDTLIKFRKSGYSHDILMDLSVITDYRNNTHHIIDLDQPTLGMPDRSYFLKGFSDPVTEAYFRIMVKAATTLGADETAAKEELKKVLQFETLLANFSLPREERRNVSRLYNKFTIKELKEVSPQIDWLKYFHGLLDPNINEEEFLIVTVPSFVKNFSQIIDKADKSAPTGRKYFPPKVPMLCNPNAAEGVTFSNLEPIKNQLMAGICCKTVANYLMWRMVGMSLSVMSKNWREIAQDYTNVLTGKNQEEPRWEQCLSSLTGTLGVALGSFYVRNYFKGDSKDIAMEMVDYIQKEFLKILKNIEWMDETTRAQAIEKAKSITPYIGYPKELLNDTAVNELYINLTLNNQTYFKNILEVKKWATDYAFNQLRKPNIKGEWKKHARAAVVNAFYNSLENCIEFPAGILQNWFFNKERPSYMNFGAIGYVIGHEITHGFDDRGRQFDKDGNNKNWWDDKTDQLFKAKAQCIIEQYGNYTVPGIELKVNGINTQGENIADNGGLKEAYKAYLSWEMDNGRESDLPGLKYTSKQLFWISAANVWCGKYKPAALKLRVVTGAHSPAQFRVIGPLSNLQEFSKDFKCPLGSPMNPVKKCQVW